jgi:peptide chain release factor subunit 1
VFEARHNYLTKVNELAMQHLLPLRLKGLIVAGSASLKNELVLDPPLQSIVLKVVDVEYGGLRGFHEAIDAVRDLLAHAPIVRERALISQFMEEIAKDTNKYAFGVDATLQALEMGVVESLLVWDLSPLVRYRIVGPDGKDTIVVQEEYKKLPKNVTVRESTPLIEWLVESCGAFGAQLNIVSNTSPEGHQFCAGFGGFGAILRYPMEMPNLEGDDVEFAADDDDSDSGEAI